jgi:hypothetical protein
MPCDLYVGPPKVNDTGGTVTVWQMERAQCLRPSTVLKAALLKRGAVERDFRKHGLRHDLSALLCELGQRDVTITDDAAATLGKLSRQHRDHGLRYTALLDDGVPVAMPEPRAVESLLDELLMCTRLRRSG